MTILVVMKNCDGFAATSTRLGNIEARYYISVVHIMQKFTLSVGRKYHVTGQRLFRQKYGKTGGASAGVPP